MYKSTRAQLVNAEKSSINDKRIKDEVNQMLRNQLLLQGVSPIVIEEETPSIAQQRESIMTTLKTITTQPSKFYDYLYNTNQISLFSMGMEEFTRKYLRYRKNLSYNQLVDAWNKYKLDPTTRLEGLSEIEKEKLRETQKAMLSSTEEKGRRELIEREFRPGYTKLFREELTEREPIRRGEVTEEEARRIKYLNTIKKNITDKLKKEQNIEKIDELWKDVAGIEALKRKARDPNVNFKELTELTKKYIENRPIPPITREGMEKESKRQERINKYKEDISYYEQQKMKFMEDIPRIINEFEEKNKRSPKSIDIDNYISSTLAQYDSDIRSIEKKMSKEMSGSGVRRAASSKKRKLNTSKSVHSMYPIYRWDWR